MKLTVRAHTSAGKREVRLIEGVYHVWTTKSPHENEANADIIALLAEHLGVAKTSLQITKGSRGKNKIVEGR